MTMLEKRPANVPALTSTTGVAVAGKDGLGVFSRPVDKPGWRSWITTVDHKKIGLMYGMVAIFFLCVGGIEALLIRYQLAQPEQKFLTADQYNRIFTMHGTTMVFLVVIPLGAAFANYFMPLQIGARDVAFPRLNAFGFWCFLAGGLFLYSSFFLGGGPDGGWYAYSPNTNVVFSPGHGMDFWALGLQIVGIASLTGAINLIVTVLNMRAPGMKLMKMPVFTWMTLVVQFLLLFAIPVITVALFLLMFDRTFHANFFNVSKGADPLLWENLFWLFGHPEVYILILPAFGIVSETLPVFSRKPLFGYPFVVVSGVAIGFMGWGVWAHHMFTSGAGPVTVTAFSISTMFIAVPTGVKIINWIATMWGGKIKFDVPMKFSVSLVSMFTIGGLSGVTHSVAPADSQQTDTYYIVAHFHYVLFGGAMMGFFAGFYYWWPKIFGHKLGDKLGNWNFWTMLVGFNLTFGPMHILGLQGMPRRQSSYYKNQGWDFWNMVSSIGSSILGIGILFFLINVWVSRKNPKCGLDPWDARTLEWMTPSSPPPAHNFDYIPEVTQLDEFFYRKYATDENHKLVRLPDPAPLPPVDLRTIHMPSPSYWPIVVAFSLPFVAAGLIYSFWISGIGGLMLLTGLFGWGIEPSVDPDNPYGGLPDAPASEALEPTNV